jgi:hypothetical protein
MKTMDEEASSSYEHLLSIPKPRRVRVSPVILIIVGSLPIASAFLVYSGVQTIRSLQQIGKHASLLYPAAVEFIFPAILLAVSSAIYWKLQRDVTLLRHGDLAIGSVTHQKWIEVRGGRGGRRKQSRIRYRFKDPAGQLFQGTGTDHTKRLLVDMPVPVFYNTANPEKNVSICTAFCELRAD